ncbi:MAG TPA: nodulation protein NfeD [Terriglobales bacterium]|nr:nodulation protein NfeD [Terriglobales bacterium]
MLRIRFAILAAIVCLAPAASAQIVRVVLNDTIQPITREVIDRAIDNAAQQNAQAVLIELSTPGGLVDSTRDIIQKILGSKVPVIVYVAPSGARAASAGFYILEAADIAAMAPATNTGAAHPVVLGGDDKLDPIMKAKMENDSAAFMRSFVSKRGRNVQLAESAVRESKSFTDQEALNQKLIDVIAKDDQDLLKQLDGRTITRFDGSKTVLHTANQAITQQQMSLRQRILDTLMDPNLAFILFAVGALALYAEFNHPGAVLPGVVGVIFILLAIFALNMLPTRYASFALIVLAFALFALEAKFASHGVLTIGGIAALTLGGLLLVDAPIPEMRVHWATALAVSVPLGVITAFLMTLAIRARRRKSMIGPQGLIGSTGVARTPLSPEGKVFIAGELWNAVASAEIPPGEAVRVRGVHGLVLDVEPMRMAQSKANS